MNEEVMKQISTSLQIKESGIKATLSLLEEGNTIPFIARYRKEATGNLDEEQIRKIDEFYMYQVHLNKRKDDVIRLIDEKGLLDEDLKNKILQATRLVEVEDLYRPFKEKKKTKATEAIKNGLEPLAKKIMTFPLKGSVENLTKPFINENVKTIEDACMGALYIIAENISDHALYRKWIRKYIYQNGVITSKKRKNAVDEKKTYEMYYEYSESIKKIRPHRILALNRAERENIITVSIDVDIEPIYSYLEKQIIKCKDSFVIDIVKNAIRDSYKRLIFPSINREIRNDLTEIGEDSAIENFSDNLEKLLLQPPMKDKWVLGFDPAYRTGCKLAVIDPTGKNVKIDVIYPHEPRNEKEEAERKMLDLINTYHIDMVAIGNGTASRESEAFVAGLLKRADHKCQYVIVSEAGASVYSASKIAIEEFPNLTVEKRSAISIGRRLQDPLSELVKIDPESIGVGLYQHDIANKKLAESLDFVVSKTVNRVGVNINTASESLFKYVSGLKKNHIKKILSYRNQNGKILSREEIQPLLSDKVYEQAVGFLRIVDGKNRLDATSIHPESYNASIQLLDYIGMKVEDIGTSKMIEILSKISITDIKEHVNADIYTLEDIIESFKKPNRDPRDDMPKPLLKSDILEISDLKVGMKLQGTVRNVVDFGAFIDIGLHNDGLAHISKLTDKYIKHPSEILGVGDIVDCYVEEIFIDKEKVALSLLEPILK